MFLPPPPHLPLLHLQVESLLLDPSLFLLLLLPLEDNDPPPR